METGLSFDPTAVVRRIGAGDASAESELVQHYLRPLNLILRVRYRDPELVRDVTQETLLVAIRNLRDGKLDSPLALTGYLRGIAINVASRYLRSEGRLSPVRPEELDARAADLDLTASLEQEELAELVRQVIDDLKQARDRELILRFYYYETPKEVLCAEFEISPAHFDRVNHRARTRLRELVENRLGRSVSQASLECLLVTAVSVFLQGGNG